MTPRAALARGLDELALTLPAGTQERLLAYIELLVKWNRTYNLTAIRDPLEMVSRHLLDSLAVVKHLPMADDGALADVGSGAGLPGIPLATARAGWRVTLNDSNQKKSAFLRQVVIELGLRNVEVHEGRVETWRPAERFSLVISRAFAELGEFMTKCRHLVTDRGWLAAMTSAAPSGVASHCQVIALDVPQLDARRHLVLCRVT